MSKATEGRLAFNLRRFWNTFRVLLGNRLSIVGLVLLVAFVIAALSAPVIYTTNPQQVIVGDQLAQPAWVSLFPEGYYLSQNMVVVNDPYFIAPSALQEWTYHVSSTSQTPYVSFSRSSMAPSGIGGSLQISCSSASPVNATVSKSFHYPYRGPPGQFVSDLKQGKFSAMVDGIAPSQGVSLRVFIDKGNKSWTLWSVNFTQALEGHWQYPSYSLSTTDFTFYNELGIRGGLPAAETIFPTAADYSYGLEVTFQGAATIYVTGIGLELEGTSYGLLGTDTAGSDLFAQDLYGTRISLLVGLLAAFIGISLGLLVGMLAGYKSGLSDEVLMRFTDMMLVIPALPLLLVLIGVLGPSLINIIVIIGFLGWMGFARVIRSQILSLKERPFIEAARAAGAGTRRILTTHIFPNIVSLTYVNLALSVPAAILTEAALSFLGLGDPVNPSWGQILHNAESFGALDTWWWVVPPGISIALISLSFVLIGYALDELFNPKLRRRR